MKVGQIAWNQISVVTKMACGAREAKLASDNEVNFKVTNKPYRFVRVEYRPGLDLYDIEYFRLKRNDYSKISIELAQGVYADQMNDIIYHMVNK